MTRFPFNGHEGGGHYDMPRKLEVLHAEPGIRFAFRDAVRLAFSHFRDAPFVDDPP